MVDAAKVEMAGKIEALEKSIEAKLSKLNDIPTTTQAIFMIGGAAIASVLAVLAILAFAGDRFDGGVAVGGQVADKFITVQRAIDEDRRKSDERFDKIILRLDEVLKVQGTKPNPPMTK
jgi:hypothetical protein